MTKFNICVFVGACIVFVAALFAGIRYNKHLELKNKDNHHEQARHRCLHHHRSLARSHDYLANFIRKN